MKTNYTLASTIADALSLSSLWVYNQSKLGRLYPNGLNGYDDPHSNYFPDRKGGDLSHYGDQTLTLAQSIRAGSGFSRERWRVDWLDSMRGYDGYLDGASKETIESKGQGVSSSNDIGGASRIGPILDLGLPLDEAIQGAREQTELTHGDPTVSDAAEFFTRTVYALQSGQDIEAAFEQATNEGHYNALPVSEALNRAREELGKDLTKTSADFGLTCHIPEAFPLTLLLALNSEGNFLKTISDNALAGGDTASRAMILALLLHAEGNEAIEREIQELSSQRFQLSSGVNRITLRGTNGKLSGILEYPEETPRAFALFAHCFTCGKDFLPEARITRALASKGIATLRIDFAGLGKSEGEFAATSFLTNRKDLLDAATWLGTFFEAPKLLIGHSLGGAAVYAVAEQIPEAKALVSIGAPADPVHVTHLFENDLEEIQREGEAEVSLGGRNFKIGKRFLDDFEGYDHEAVMSKLRGVNTLIMHAPSDSIVSLDNAGQIYSALLHPKSFISLPRADHLLTDPKQAEYVASLIESWADQDLV